MYEVCLERNMSMVLFSIFNILLYFLNSFSDKMHWGNINCFLLRWWFDRIIFFVTEHDLQQAFSNPLIIYRMSLTNTRIYDWNVWLKSQWLVERLCELAIPPLDDGNVKKFYKIYPVLFVKPCQRIINLKNITAKL